MVCEENAAMNKKYIDFLLFGVSSIISNGKQY